MYILIYHAVNYSIIFNRLNYSKIIFMHYVLLLEYNVHK